MELNVEMLKKPFTWALIIPSVLGLWTIIATVKMVGIRTEAGKQAQVARLVEKKVQEIESIRKRTGEAEGSLIRSFDLASSTRECAEAAQIPEAKIIRGENSRSKQQKDGKFQHTQSYKLKSIKLIQIARFIDFAEINYSSLHCAKLQINPARSKSKDAWDATITFIYLKK